MNPLDEFTTKTNAVSYICMQTGYGRPSVERALKQLQEAGRIHPTTLPHATLLSRADIELIIKVLKKEIE
jgi:hypothetical protein